MTTSTSIFTAVLAAALAVPGLCGSRVVVANSLKPTIELATVTTPPGNGHVHAWTPVARAPQVSICAVSIPEPTQTLQCDKSVGPIQHTQNGQGWQVNCGHDFPGKDLCKLQANSWGGCMEACSVTAGCKAFVFVLNQPNMIDCYLKTGGTGDTWFASEGTQCGWIYDPPPTTLATTSKTTTTTTTPLRTAAYTPLSDYHQLDYVADASWTIDCYSTGAVDDDALDMYFVARFFCEQQNNRNNFGGYYPDRVLLPGDAITLIYWWGPQYTINAILNVKAGTNCVIDFDNMSVDECVQYWNLGLLDAGCNRGGIRDNNCTRWVIDPNWDDPHGFDMKHYGPYWYHGVWDN